MEVMEFEFRLKWRNMQRRGTAAVFEDCIETDGQRSSSV